MHADPHNAEPTPRTPDLYAQYVLCSKLAKLWPSLSDGQRTTQIKAIAPSISRCHQAADREAGEEILRRIVLLPEEAIYEALSWTDREYTLAPGEEVYSQLTGFLARYLRWARPGNAPLGFHFWAGIAALGAACQRRIFVPAGRRIYMNMYVILGGHQSTGKGQALEPAIKLLERVNDILAPHPEFPERRVNILPSDVTMESLVTELANRVNVKSYQEAETGLTRVEETEIDATGILPLDEMATFFGKDAWAQARRAPFMTTIKESDFYQKRTKRDGQETLKNLAISMVACCAPDWMQNTIESDLLGGGFMDRTMWVYREPVWERRRGTSIINSEPKDPVMLQLLAEWVVAKISSLGAREPAQLDPAAKHRLHGIYQELVTVELDSYERFGADSQEKTANRKIWILTQVATLISISETSFPPVRVSINHVDLAYKILRLEDASMKQFLDEGLRSKTVYWDRKFLAFIIECGGCVLKGLINKQFRRHLTSTDEATRILKNLLDQDMVEQVKYNNKIVYRERGHRCTKCEIGLNQ